MAFQKKKIQNKGSKEVYEVFLGLLEARLKIKYVYYKLTNNLQTFVEKWSVGNVLCFVDTGGELVLFFNNLKIVECDVIIMGIFINC